MTTIVEIVKSATFDRWLGKLKDRRAAARVLVRIDRLVAGNPGDVRPVGSGISELRIDYGPGYRVYYLHEGNQLVLLLTGGDKSTQDADIKSAHDIAPGVAHETRSALMSNETFSRFDPADYLNSVEDVVAYLEAVIDEGGDDPATITQALGLIARSRNLSEIARQVGMSREGLYKALSPNGNPSFATVVKISRALGLRVHFDAIA